MAAKRIRKPNFSEKEIRTLLEELSLEVSVLFSSLSPSISQKRKNVIWGNICTSVNSCGVANRTTQDLKDKWKGLKVAALNRQRDIRKTGGGPPPPPVPYEELILGIIGKKIQPFHWYIEGKSRLALSVIFSHPIKHIVVRNTKTKYSLF
jgi:hypothetical protein